MCPNLIEIAYYFIEKSETLYAVFADGVLLIEVPEVRNGGKHDTDTVIALVVQLL